MRFQSSASKCGVWESDPPVRMGLCAGIPMTFNDVLKCRDQVGGFCNRNPVGFHCMYGLAIKCGGLQTNSRRRPTAFWSFAMEYGVLNRIPTGVYCISEFRKRMESCNQIPGSVLRVLQHIELCHRDPAGSHHISEFCNQMWSLQPAIWMYTEALWSFAINYGALQLHSCRSPTQF